jgi:NAD(P)-dependent dehydrogenase (short-subunit alcohol dehydrogenase family)
LPSVPYELSTEADLAETAVLVEKAGGRAVTAVADVRDRIALDAAVAAGLAEFGRLDIVVANAGVMYYGLGGDTSDDEHWQEALGVLLTGVRNTLKATEQALIEGGRGGAVVITSSTAGLKGYSDGTGGTDGYTAAKFAVVGLMEAYAKRLAPHRIRVNTVHPTGVLTPMIMNEAFGTFMAQHPHLADAMQNLLPVPAIEADDVSDAVVWLTSDAAKYVTGVRLPVDAGYSVR